MTRKSLLGLLALGLCLPLSCNVVPEVRVEVPPKEGGAAAEQWWEKTVDSLPLPFLAAYAEASETHRKKKTSTTYIDWYQAFGKYGMVQQELHLPTPPPEAAFARIRERVKDFKVGAPAAPDKRQDHIVMAEDCQGCALHQAMEVWHDALKKVGLPVPHEPEHSPPTTKPSAAK
jgi:hypothetical protein